jgi:hypothetical protein
MDRETGQQQKVSIAELKLQQRGSYFIDIEPLPMPEVENPDAPEYLRQLTLLRAARLELGDKTVA